MRAQRALGRAGGAGGIEDRGVIFRQERHIGHGAVPADSRQWAGAPMTSSSTVTPGRRIGGARDKDMFDRRRQVLQPRQPLGIGKDKTGAAVQEAISQFRCRSTRH